MPPKVAGGKARKSTAGVTGKPSSRASVVKPASKVQVSVGDDSDSISSPDENAPAPRKRKAAAPVEDEEADELKSNHSDSDEVAEELTSASARKQRGAAVASRKNIKKASQSTESASPPKRTSTAGRQSLKAAPASTSKAIKGGRPSLSSKAAKKPASEPAPSKKKATKTTRAKTEDGEEKRKRKRTTGTTSGSDSDDESAPTTRSRSARGYTWEAEIINIEPEVVMNKLAYHATIKTDIEADSDAEDDEPYVKFKRDQIIYILPDPSTLPPRSEEIPPDELPDDDFWACRILDCCALDQGNGQPPLGLLRIAWFYSPDQAMKIDGLHKDWVAKLKKYRFGQHEMIASDHVDFVGVDVFAGYPRGLIYTDLMVHGLEVDDAERMKKPALRRATGRIKRITGFPGTNGGRGVGPMAHLDKLMHETPEERERRRRKEAKKAEKKRRASEQQDAVRDDEGTDQE